ncbi:MAG: hypothetical protein RLZZ126_650 [Pseudomonadota bacterium]
MNTVQLFLPCAAGVEDLLLAEVQRVLGGMQSAKQRGGVVLHAGLDAFWPAVQRLNLHSRLAQRVLLRLSETPYRNEKDLYRAAKEVPWEEWFTPRQSIKVEITAQHSPLQSLNFAALTVKDAVCDRFRDTAGGVRPDVDTRWPDMRVFAHLTTDTCTLYLDTSGEPLFKRGWRSDTGDAPLKETLAAAMLEACGWADRVRAGEALPLYDPCCGSGTIAIEAAQIVCGIAPGSQRRFAFEKMIQFESDEWNAIKTEAINAHQFTEIQVFGSDVAHRMVDFAGRNAERAGVARALELRGGDALQRMPPLAQPGIILLNPPYGERIAVAGVAGIAAEAVPRFGARELAEVDGGGEFFARLASHWKSHYAGWTAWMLTPDLKLPGKMRMKESRRVPMWNGPIECRLFRFDITARRAAAVSAPP